MGDNIEIIDSYTVILQEDQNTQTQNVDIASPIQIQTIESNAQSLTIETQQQIDLYMDKQGTPIINLKGVAQEQTLIEKTEEIKNTIVNTTPKVDLTPVAKETTLNSAKEEILTAVDNAKPEIDTTELAKQGENPNATLTAIYKLLIGSNEPSPDIPEGVAERLALILEFFGMKPIEAYEFMTPEEVCSELEDIMTSMDLALTPQQAQEITNNTLTN